MQFFVCSICRAPVNDEDLVYVNCRSCGKYYEPVAGVFVASGPPRVAYDQSQEGRAQNNQSLLEQYQKTKLNVAITDRALQQFIYYANYEQQIDRIQGNGGDSFSKKQCDKMRAINLDSLLRRSTV